MTHDGSKDPIDFTISNAIYDLMRGKPEGEVADDLGWELEEIMNIHPITISSEKLIEIADKQHWPKPHLHELLQSIENHRARLNIDETEPLPADAGRIGDVLLQVLKYDVFGDGAVGR